MFCFLPLFYLHFTLIPLLFTFPIVIFFISPFHSILPLIHRFLFYYTVHIRAHHSVSYMLSSLSSSPLSSVCWYSIWFSSLSFPRFSHQFRKFVSPSCSLCNALSNDIFSSTSDLLLTPLPHPFPTPSSLHAFYFLLVSFGIQFVIILPPIVHSVIHSMITYTMCCSLRCHLSIGIFSSSS